MPRPVDPFCAGAVRRFSTHVGRLLREELELPERCRQSFIRHTGSAITRLGPDGLEGIANDVERTGIRTRWNRVLDTRRPIALAQWVTPYVEGPLLDLFSGNGLVGQAIAATGCSVTMADPHEAGHRAGPAAGTFLTVDHLGRIPDSHAYGTVLLCTVLHHADEADALLTRALGLAARRLIVIENAVEAEFPADYQVLMDLFFNRCLNPSAAPVTGEHRRTSEWIAAACRDGDLLRMERRAALPGIPLAHQLIVVDLSRQPPESARRNR